MATWRPAAALCIETGRIAQYDTHNADAAHARHRPDGERLFSMPSRKSNKAIKRRIRVASPGRPARGRRGVRGQLPLLLWTPACRAELLPITLSFLVVTNINGTLTYNAATVDFHSESLPIVITSPDYPGGLGTFINDSIPNQTVIDLFVNQNGLFTGNGTIQMFGSVAFNDDSTADATGLLLSGTITAFGSEPPGPPTRDFNGLFTITGGALTQDVPLSGGGTVFGGFPVGGTGGFLLSAENVTSGTLGNFTADFSSDTGKARRAWWSRSRVLGC
jgi:hypothetical protein